MSFECHRCGCCLPKVRFGVDWVEFKAMRVLVEYHGVSPRLDKEGGFSIDYVSYSLKAKVQTFSSKWTSHVQILRRRIKNIISFMTSD